MINIIDRIRKRRIARDAIWTAFGQIFSALAFLASVKFMTKILSPDDFGRLTLSLAISALALGFSTNPQLQALTRYYTDWQRSGNIHTLRSTGKAVITRTVCIATAILFSGWLGYSILFGGKWYDGVWIAIILIIDSIRLFEISLLNAARRQRDAALLSSGDAWSRPLFAVGIIAITGPSATAALAGYATGSVIVILVMRLVSLARGQQARNISETKGLPVHSQADPNLAAAIRRYAKPLVPLALFGWLSGVGDRFVIGGLLNMHDAGLYAAAYGLASRPFMMLTAFIELTLRPILYDAVSNNDKELVRISKMAFIISTVSGGVIGVLAFAILDDFIGKLLFAPDYYGAIDLMPWVALGYALYSLSMVYSRLCYVFDDTKGVLILTATGTLSGFAILLPAIHLGGLPGAVLSVPTQFGVELVLSVIFALRAERRFYQCPLNISSTRRQ